VSGLRPSIQLQAQTRRRCVRTPGTVRAANTCASSQSSFADRHPRTTGESAVRAVQLWTTFQLDKPDRETGRQSQTRIAEAAGSRKPVECNGKAAARLPQV